MMNLVPSMAFTNGLKTNPKYPGVPRHGLGYEASYSRQLPSLDLWWDMALAEYLCPCNPETKAATVNLY